MRFFVRPALYVLLTAGVAIPMARAEDLSTPSFKIPDGSAKASPRSAAKPNAKAAPKPSGSRRAGELEGWEGDAKTPAASSTRRRPADAIGEHALPDGGLPLPERRFSNDGPGMGKAPITFDQNGNMGGAFRF